MAGRKSIRTRGKLQLSKYFQDIHEGDRVAIVAEPAMQPRFPKRLQGKTGVVEAKRGSSYVVVLKDISKEKRFIVDPIHLKKIRQVSA